MANVFGALLDYGDYFISAHKPSPRRVVVNASQGTWEDASCSKHKLPMAESRLFWFFRLIANCYLLTACDFGGTKVSVGCWRGNLRLRLIVEALFSWIFTPSQFPLKLRWPTVTSSAAAGQNQKEL
jgi:hypothetical protein